MSSKTALITGASSGFGFQFAKNFAKDGNNLILTALSGDRLAETAEMLRQQYNVKVDYIEMDLGRPGAAEEMYKWVQKKGLHADYLINNAGIGLYGKFTDHALAEEQELIYLNMVVLSELCHFFIKDMIKHGGGKILNVASIAAFQAGPYYATYFASKAYVLLFSEALYYEYSDKNITVTALCPGVARTNFFKRAKMREDSRLLTSYFMTAEQVVRAGYKGMLKGKRIVIPGRRNVLVAYGYRILPRGVVNSITRRMIKIAAE